MHLELQPWTFPKAAATVKKPFSTCQVPGDIRKTSHLAKRVIDLKDLLRVKLQARRGQKAARGK